MTTIGIPVVCVLWAVQCRYCKGKDPQGNAKMVEVTTFVTTPDTTGADVLQNTIFAVLGESPHDGHELTIVHLHRVGDAKGHALPAVAKTARLEAAS